MKHIYARLVGLFLISLNLLGQNAFADGSKDLYPAGILGKRATLISNNNALYPEAYPFMNRGVQKVYAKVGEKLYIGQSGQGMNVGTIRVFKPTTVINGTRSNADFNSGSSTTIGRINNRTEEKLGPNINGTVAGGYTPFVVTVDVEGVWEVDLISPAGTTSYGNSSPGNNGAYKGLADANWTQSNSTPSISAWDVTVANGNTPILGRVYINVFNAYIESDFSANNGFYGKFFVLTKDGFPYQVDNNGMMGVAFTFFVNNRGFTSAADGQGTRTFQSQANATTANVKDPNDADDANNLNITHKLFYASPATDLPATATYSGSSNSTWLKLNNPPDPEATQISFKGVEGSSGYASSKGAAISFEANIVGNYKITIPGGTTNGVTYYKRVIYGATVFGTNTVTWDGKTGTQADPLIAAGPIPPGSSIGNITIQLLGAEVHFPFLDMESNANGIKILQLNKNTYAVPLTGADIVYWDDSGITTNSGQVASSPSKVVPGGSGQPSRTNGHKWGANGDADGPNEYGNTRAMDTYSFVPGPEATVSINLVIKQADLEVVSITKNKTTAFVGDEITYTVVVKNNNNANSVSDVEKATFRFDYPTGFNVTSVVKSGITGTVTAEPGAITGATQFKELLNMTSGSQFTYTIKGTVGQALKNTTINTQASITRPNDVTDPDATSPSLPFSDNAQTECDGDGVGCNNIKIPSGVSIINSPPVVAVINKTPVLLNTTIAFTAADFTSKYIDVDGDAMTKIKVVNLPSNGLLKLSGGNITAGQEILLAQLGNITFVPTTGYVGIATFDWNGFDGTTYAVANAAVNMTINNANKTISGNVYNDTNGLLGTPTNTVDGSLYTTAGLNTVLYNTTLGQVAAVSAVTGGAYSFSVPDGNYTIYLTTASPAIASTAIPTITLPVGYVSTGENIGAGAGQDGTVNSILPLGMVTANVSNANFGIEQNPTVAGSGSNTAANPGGTIQVTVPVNTFSNTTASSDPTLVTGIRITSFPTNTTTIVINGVTYAAADLAALTSIVIPTDGNGTPTQTITLDPIGLGSSVISFKSVDAAGKESAGTGTATMNINNTAPVANPDINSTNKNVTLTVANNAAGDILLNDTDANGDALTVTKYTIGGVDYTAGTSHLITGQGTITINADGSYTFVPVTNFVGAVDVISYSISDGNGGTASSTLTLTVNATNVAPVANPDINSTNEDITLTVTAAAGLVTNDTDGDGNALTVTKYTIGGVDYTAGTSHLIAGQGTITINANGSYTFVPVANYNGPVDVITYSISDGNGGTASSTLTLTVNPVNDIPSFTKGADQTKNINSPAQTVSTWATGLVKGPANESTQALSFVVSNNKNSLFAVQPSISATGTLTYTPASDQYGKATVTVQVQDNGGTANGGVDISAAQTFEIIIKPVGVTDSYTTPKNVSLTSTVTSNDGASGVGTTVAKATDPSHGSIVVNANGTITYTPTSGYTGTDSYTYKLVTPDGVESDPITVNITINNTAPVANPDVNNTSQNVTLTVTNGGAGDILLNDTDVNGDALTVTKYTISGIPGDQALNSIIIIPNVGSINIKSDGSYVFVPTTNYYGIVPEITYTITDGTATSTSTLNITVDPTNITIAGNVYNDTNGLLGSPANTIDGALYTTAGLNAVLVNTTTNLVAALATVTGGTYSFNVPIGNYSVYLTTATVLVGAATPTVVLPSGYVSTGEFVGTGAGNDGTVNSIISLGAVATNVSNVNFGIEQNPTVAGTGSNTASNPGSTAQITVPNNTFSNITPSSDPTLVTGIRITAFPTNTTTIVINGTTYTVADLATLTALVIPTDASGKPTQTITLDPITSTTSVISFRSVDAAGKESAGIGTATMNIVNTPPTTDDKTNAAISSSTAVPVDIVNPTGFDVDGTVTGFKITSLPTTGTLYMANGTTLVTLNQILTPAEADGLKFKPSGTSNANVTFTIAARDNDGAEDSTPATITIPLTNTPPTTDDKTNAAISSSTAVPVDIVNPTASDVDGTVTGFKITSLPTTGTLYMANGTTLVTLNQILTPAEADGLKFKPSGTSNANVTFTIAARDNDGAEDSTPATITIPLTNTPPTTDDKTNAAISSSTAVPVDIVNPTGSDVDGTVTGFKITSLPTTGTLYMANGTTLVTLNQILTPAEADGLKFKPSGTSNANVTFTIAARDNDGAEDSTPATITIPLTNTPPTTNDITNTNQIPVTTTTPTDIDNFVGADADGTVTHYKVTSLPTTGTLYMADGTTLVTLNQELTIVEAAGLKFKPDNTNFSKVTFTYAAKDNDGLLDATPATFTINIKPVGVTDNDLTPINTPVTTTVTINDGVSGTGTTVIAGPNPPHGTLIVNPDKTITYTPVDPLYVGNDTYTYTLQTPDGIISDPITVNINVYRPQITLTKEGAYVDTNADGKVNVGDRINYTFNVTNTGTITVNNITITDANAVLTGGPITLAPGASNAAAFTGYHVLTQADINNGGVFNVATATGKDPRNNDVTATSTDPTPLAPTDPSYPVTPPTPACPTCTVTPIVQSGSMTVAKEGVYADTNADGKVNVGDRINYTFNVVNTGNVTLTNITITDANAVLTGGPITLAPSASNAAAFTGYHVLTQADINNGGVFNVATATGKDPRNNDVTATSTDPTPLAPTDPSYPVTPPTPACPTCTVTPIVQSGSLKLTKDGNHEDTNGDGKVNVGDHILYTFIVTNTGNVTLTNVTITDPNAIMSGGPLVSLAPGASNSTMFTAYYTVTQADLDNGGVFNLATVTAKDPRNKTITATSTDPTPTLPYEAGYPINSPSPDCPTCTVSLLPQKPAIRLIKTGVYVDSNGDGIANIGDHINYSFKVENTGNVTVNDITITDLKVSVTGGPIKLAPGAIDAVTFKAVYSITQADIAKGGVYNIATATGKDPRGGSVTDQSESGNPSGPGAPPVDPSCPTCTITPLKGTSSIRLIKTGTYTDTNGDGKVNLGDQIKYAFSIQNNGTLTVFDIRITDPKVMVTGGPITLEAGAVDNTTFKAVYNLTQADLDKGAVYNLATATGKDVDGKPVTDNSENGNNVPGGPDGPQIDPNCPTCTINPLPKSGTMRLTKTGTYVDTNGDGKANVGDQINYVFKIENTGSVNLTGITVTDPKVTVTGGPINLAVGAVNSTTFKAIYMLTQADIDKGAVYNMATATGKDPQNNTVTDESESGNGTPGGPGAPQIDPACPTCTITPLTPAGSLRLIKTSSYIDFNGDGKTNVGDRINYSFSVQNTGNVTLSNITVTDAKVTVTGGPITLAPGVTDNVTFRAIYTITQADIDKGSVYNVATATGKDPQNNTITDQSESGNTPPSGPGAPPIDPACPTCTITPLTQEGKIVLVKKGTFVDSNGDGFVQVGEKMTYTFTVTNIGAVPITGLVINDAKIGAVNLPLNPSTLIPGAVGVATGEYSITRADIDLGRVINTATATGKDPNGKDVSDISGNAADNNNPTENVLPIHIGIVDIPNIITPNGDGKNDIFIIIGRENYESIELEVFNRWGNQVYRNKNYKSDWMGDGLNEGTYFYTVKLKRGRTVTVQKGWVLIKR